MLPKRKNQKGKKKNPKEKSSQQTLPYLNEYKDGILEVSKGVYSKTMVFTDINYQTARLDEQESIFTSYCDLLNSYGANVGVQITVNNKFINKEALSSTILVKSKEDGLDAYRKEYNKVLDDKLSEGENSVEKKKYITISIKANNIELAKTNFSRIEAETASYFKKIGSQLKSLDLIERMEVLHDIYRSDNVGKLNAEMIGVAKKHGLGSKDCIAPDIFEFKRDHFMIDDKYAQVLYLKDFPNFLADKILRELTDFNFNLTTSIAFEPIEPSKANKMVSAQITSMESDKQGIKKRARKQGDYDPYIPHKLRTALTEAEELLGDIVSKDQKLFLTTITILHIAESKEKLQQQYESILQATDKKLFGLGKLYWRQEEGLNNVIPYGLNTLKVERCLTTDSAAIFMPFDTMEIFQKDGIYYGQNAISRNIIMINRKKLKTPSGFILGTPGSGKSFEQKKEQLAVILNSGDDVIIIDPEREYTELVRGLGGEVIHISAASDNFINPLDLTEAYSDDENGKHDPLLVKSDFIISLLETLIGGKTGLTPTQISIIDRCAKVAYEDLYANSFNPQFIPTLKDFYNIIMMQTEPEAKELASRLELYVLGTLKVFSNKTNVQVNNRIVCYDTKDLGKNLKVPGMLIVLDAIWNRITTNRAEGKRTWVDIDEIQVFFGNPLLEGYFDEIWRRFRKWGGIPTGITQNVTPLLKSEIAYNMLQNTEFVIMMAQATQDRQKLAELYNISDSQMSYITNPEEGHGLIYAGGNIIPLADIFPKDTSLYRMMTTKIEEISNNSEKKKWTL